MGKKILVQAIKLLLGIQILVSFLSCITYFIALFSSDVNYNNTISILFDSVMIVRFGTIITFSVSCLLLVLFYFLKTSLIKPKIGVIVGILGIIINFVLKPYSSVENFVPFMKNFYIKYCYNTDNIGDVTSRVILDSCNTLDEFLNSCNALDAPSPVVHLVVLFVVLILLSIISFSLCICSFDDLSELQNCEKNI